MMHHQGFYILRTIPDGTPIGAAMTPTATVRTAIIESSAERNEVDQRALGIPRAPEMLKEVERK